MAATLDDKMGSANCASKHSRDSEAKALQRKLWAWWWCLVKLQTRQMGSTMETQVLGQWGASKLGKAQEEDTERILSPLPRAFHLNMSQLLTCSLLALENATASCSWRSPGKNPARLVFLNSLAGCTSWLIHKAESLPTCVTLLDRRKVCAY